MERLGIGFNPIDDDAANILWSAIHNIEFLEIQECRITSQGMKILSENIEKQNGAVTCFYL